MFHWFGTVQNTRGDAQVGAQVGLVEVDTQTVVPIFSDESSTPIVSVSGIANRAIADANGNYEFFVPNGTYTLQFYNAAGVFQRAVRSVPMFGSELTSLPVGPLGARAVSFEGFPGTGLYSVDGSGIVVSADAKDLVTVNGTDGSVSVGVGLLTGSFVFGVANGKDGGFLAPKATTTQRDAYAVPVDGLVVYNTTTSKLQVRAGGAWVDLH